MDRADADSLTPVLLYDGDCGFCARSVQFVLSREPASRQDRLRFAPLQGEYGSQVRARYPHIKAVDSVVWYDPSADGPAAVQVRSQAVLRVLEHLGGAWSMLARVGVLVPRPLRDAAYDLVARHRLALAAPACLLPTAAQRRRFLP